MNQLMEPSANRVGEAVHPREGLKMIREHHKSFPGAVASYTVGTRILQQLLDQKGSCGLRLYPSLTENGFQTLVYLSENEDSELLFPKPGKGKDGELKLKFPIIADRARPGTRPGLEADDLNWGLPD